MEIMQSWKVAVDFVRSFQSCSSGVFLPACCLVHHFCCGQRQGYASTCVHVSVVKCFSALWNCHETSFIVVFWDVMYSLYHSSLSVPQICLLHLDSSCSVCSAYWIVLVILHCWHENTVNSQLFSLISIDDGWALDDLKQCADYYMLLNVEVGAVTLE